MKLFGIVITMVNHDVGCSNAQISIGLIPFVFFSAGQIVLTPHVQLRFRATIITHPTAVYFLLGVLVPGACHAVFECSFLPWHDLVSGVCVCNAVEFHRIMLAPPFVLSGRLGVIVCFPMERMLLDAMSLWKNVHLAIMA